MIPSNYEGLAANGIIEALVDGSSHRQSSAASLIFGLLMPFSAQNIASDLLKALPSVKARWDEHLEFWGDEERGYFNDMTVFARHVVECYRRGQTDEFGSVFALIERFVSEGPPDVRELATIGLLEDIQTIGSHDRWGYEVFEQWLGPNSRTAWKKIESAWEGKTSLMDVVRSEQSE